MRCPECGTHMVPDHEWATWDCRNCGHSVTDMTLTPEDKVNDSDFIEDVLQHVFHNSK